MSWPRGSNIRPVRIQSNSARKCWRRSLMLAPESCGPPPITTRTGLPQVCASTQLKVNFAMVLPATMPSRYLPELDTICNGSAACFQQITDLRQQLFAGRRRHGFGRRGGFLLLQPIHLLHQQKDRERHDQEIDDRVDEDTVIDADRSRILRRFQGGI